MLALLKEMPIVPTEIYILRAEMLARTTETPIPQTEIPIPLTEMLSG